MAYFNIFLNQTQTTSPQPISDYTLYDSNLFGSPPDPEPVKLSQNRMLFNKNIHSSESDIVYTSDSLNISNDSKIIRILETTKPIRQNNFNYYSSTYEVPLTNTSYNLVQNLEPITFAPSFPIITYLS